MQILCAMSGGVDSSVAAALLKDEGHEVVGVTMKLWGGESDTGCCSVSDVDDARRVAQQLGIDHVVFNFTEEFDARVVDPYVRAHAKGTTPNPCVECNRHLKFDRLLARALALGFDAVATGHHARLVAAGDGSVRLGRGADRAKDQSYVLGIVGPDALSHCRFPVGALTKREVRERAAALGLRTARKAESQEVCFVARRGGGRAGFLARRIPLHPADVVDRSGARLGRVDAVELVTVGQRRGLGLPGGTPPRFAVEVDVRRRVVVTGDADDLLVEHQPVRDLTWWGGAPPVGPVLVQCSAHGAVRAATARPEGFLWNEPQRRVAPGQTVVVYDAEDDMVLGWATAA